MESKPNFDCPSFFTASSIVPTFVTFAIVVIFAVASSFSTIKPAFSKPLAA